MAANEEKKDRTDEQPPDKSGGQISVADIKNAAGVAIGDGARATVIYGDVFYGAQEQKVPWLDVEPKKEDLIIIPKGPFLMGSDEKSAVEAPQHSVDLPAYAIARFPVTNQEFANFLWDTRKVAAKVLRWQGNEPRQDKLNHPVTGVTWYEAVAYCQWLEEKSKRPYRLPNEAQWEKAARGIDGRLYPWGNAWEDGRCNTESVITTVDAFPPQSSYGIFDMVGNAREWTLTNWGSDMDAPDHRFAYPWKEDRRNNPDEPSTTWRVYRGGRYFEPSGHRCTARAAYMPDKPGPKSNRHGFRVVMLLEEK